MLPGSMLGMFAVLMSIFAFVCVCDAAPVSVYDPELFTDDDGNYDIYLRCFLVE